METPSPRAARRCPVRNFVTRINECRLLKQIITNSETGTENLQLMENAFLHHPPNNPFYHTHTNVVSKWRVVYHHHPNPLAG